MTQCYISSITFPVQKTFSKDLPDWTSLLFNLIVKVCREAEKISFQDNTTSRLKKKTTLFKYNIIFGKYYKNYSFQKEYGWIKILE